jgi:hypothetical protein
MWNSPHFTTLQTSAVSYKVSFALFYLHEEMRRGADPLLELQRKDLDARGSKILKYVLQILADLDVEVNFGPVTRNTLINRKTISLVCRSYIQSKIIVI